MDFQTPSGNAVKHFVAKVVKTFGRVKEPAESLDDFRYGKACFLPEKNASRRCLKGSKILRPLQGRRVVSFVPGVRCSAATPGYYL